MMTVDRDAPYRQLTGAIRQARSWLDAIPAARERLALLIRVRRAIAIATDAAALLAFPPESRLEQEVAFVKLRLAAALADVEQLIDEARAQKGLGLVGRARHELSAALGAVDRLRRAAGSHDVSCSTTPW